MQVDSETTLTASPAASQDAQMNDGERPQDAAAAAEQAERQKFERKFRRLVLNGDFRAARATLTAQCFDDIERKIFLRSVVGMLTEHVFHFIHQSPSSEVTDQTLIQGFVNSFRYLGQLEQSELGRDLNSFRDGDMEHSVGAIDDMWNSLLNQVLTDLIALGVTDIKNQVLQVCQTCGNAITPARRESVLAIVEERSQNYEYMIEILEIAIQEAITTCLPNPDFTIVGRMLRYYRDNLRVPDFMINNMRDRLVNFIVDFFQTKFSYRRDPKSIIKLRLRILRELQAHQILDDAEGSSGGAVIEDRDHELTRIDLIKERCNALQWELSDMPAAAAPSESVDEENQPQLMIKRLETQIQLAITHCFPHPDFESTGQFLQTFIDDPDFPQELIEQMRVRLVPFVIRFIAEELFTDSPLMTRYYRQNDGESNPENSQVIRVRQEILDGLEQHQILTAAQVANIRNRLGIRDEAGEIREQEAVENT